MSVPKILVVDDDPKIQLLLTDTLGAEGFDVVTAADGQAALDHVRSDPPAIVLLDLRIPGIDGMVTLEKIQAVAPKIPVVMLTAHGDIPSAVRAMRLGAFDYLTKPVHSEEIVLTVRRALERRSLVAEVEELRNQLEDFGAPRELMGLSGSMQQIAQQVKQVARSTLTVLIQGETGTGKELVARAIHQLSDRREKPFIALDCGAIPDTLIESELFGYEKGAFTGADRRKEGHFQLAEGGSLFLDEIANLPLATQSRFLRILQEREVHMLGGKHPVQVNVRIIAASNVPLEAEVQAGRFRQDLYYRLNEFVISLPPLRERHEDILPLARRFLTEASMEFGRPVRDIAEEGARRLLAYPWPGNVRELRNVIRQAVLLASDLIGPEHLMALTAENAPAHSRETPIPAPARLSLRERADLAAALAEQQAIRQALQATRGNKSEAARLLRTDYKTLHLKMKRHGIRAGDFAI